MTNCTYCDEPVLDGEQHHAFPGEAMHWECGFRAVGGSVAHVLRRCSCFVPGSTLGDPPGMSRREAARKARELWVQIDGWFGIDLPDVLPTSHIEE